MKKHTFEKGLYVIGDPCYFINDENWDKVLEDTNFFGCPMVNDKKPADWDEGLFHYKGKPCFAHATKYGDGEYRILGRGKSVAVDSGAIGVMPLLACDTLPELSDLYEIISFGKNFEVWEDNGVFYIGKYVIDTN